MTSTQHLLDNYDPVGVDRALAKELRTSFAIFFHTVRDRELAMTTAHQVSSDANGTPVVGPGRPLTPEDEQRVLDLRALGVPASPPSKSCPRSCSIATSTR